MSRYNVNLDKRIFMEFLLFKWWDSSWLRYKGANRHLHMLEVIQDEYEKAVTYIEQQGNVDWEFEDKHGRILNMLIPTHEYGKKDFILEWKQYKRDYYSSPWELKNKFEY